jgi:hypothetical protein
MFNIVNKNHKNLKMFKTEGKGLKIWKKTKFNHKNKK